MAFRLPLSIKIILTSYCFLCKLGYDVVFPRLTSSLQSYIYSAKISIHFINISISPECLSCILRVQVVMGSWHGFRRLIWGLTCCLCLLSVCFSNASAHWHTHQLVERHLTEESAQAHLSFMLLLCPLVKHLRGLLFS